MKQQTRMDNLLDLLKKIHNPQVVAVYSTADEAEDVGWLASELQIKPEDTFNETVLKCLIFYLASGRVNAIAPIPTFWAAKAERFRPQLAIAYRPTQRKKLSYLRYQGNGLLHIPHFDGKQRDIKIAPYVVGQYSCKYTLKDGSNIIVNAKTDEEALKHVQNLARYVKASQKPKGGVEQNCSFTKRGGEPLLLDGVEMKPFKAAYYENGKKSQTPTWTKNL
jgi:hypothetical protein